MDALLMALGIAYGLLTFAPMILGFLGWSVVALLCLAAIIMYPALQYAVLTIAAVIYAVSNLIVMDRIAAKGQLDWGWIILISLFVLRHWLDERRHAARKKEEDIQWQQRIAPNA